MRKILITLIKSKIGIIPKHKLCLKGLGLSKINQSVTREDTPSVRGMITKINYLVKVEAVNA
jgi:large subunit ribosomal protein L30